MSSLAVRAIASLLRPLRRIGAVDASRAANFRTAAEEAEWAPAEAARHAAAERDTSMAVARRVLLRGARADDAAALALTAPSGAGAGAGDERSRERIGGIDATAFLVIWGTVATLPALLYSLLCDWAEANTAARGDGDARLTNRSVLDKRLEAVERLLAEDAAAARRRAFQGADAPPPPASSSAGLSPAPAPSSSSCLAAVPARASFLAGVADELARRRAAMLKPEAANAIAEAAAKTVAEQPGRAGATSDPSLPPQP